MQLLSYKNSIYQKAGIVMDSRVLVRLLVFSVVLSVGAPASVYGTLSESTKKESNVLRLSQLVEANVIATHAYQVLLAQKSGKGDPTCFGSGKLSHSELEALVEHQAKLLKSNMPALNAWARGAQSNFQNLHV
jgi:hypothetical protein